MNSSIFVDKNILSAETEISITLKNVNWKYTHVPNCNRPK